METKRYNSFKDCPRTKDQWWKLVDTYWIDLLHIAHLYIPLHNYEKISEKKSEVITATVPISITLEKLKQERNPHLCRYFFAIWDCAPDCKDIHSVKNWSLLCDLLSEEYVLYDEENI